MARRIPDPMKTVRMTRPSRVLLRQLATERARVKELRLTLAMMRSPIVVERVGEPSDPERFVQLVTQRIGAASVILALDGTGRVHKYQHQTKTWAPMPMERGEEVAYVKGAPNDE